MLILTLLSCFAVVSPLAFWQKTCKALVQRLLTLAFLAFSISFFILVWSFVSGDYSVRVVWDQAQDAMPWWFKWTAIWANHDGSWMLWLLLLFSATFLGFRKLPNEMDNRVWLISASGLLMLLLAYALFFSNPFLRLLPLPPPDGMGLNPLLQDGLFLIHPPLLYAGSTSTMVLFYDILQASWGKAEVLSAWWVARIRLWVLWSWSMLSSGIALGAFWAYRELGWGGWWFWDPVENTALMPWLILTGLLHAPKGKMLSEIGKRQVLLCLLAPILVLFGVFVVRSGLLVSVHNFAQSPLKGLYLALVLMLFLGVGGCTFVLREGKKFNSPQSGYGCTAWQTWWKYAAQTFFMGVCAWVFFATMLPWVMDTLLGKEISVGPGYYETFLLPLSILLLIMMGFSQSTKDAWHSIRYKGYWSLALAALMMLGVWLLLGDFISYIEGGECALLCVTLAWCALAHVGRAQECGARSVAFGMWIAHAGVLMCILAVYLAAKGQVRVFTTLSPGETVSSPRMKVDFRKVWTSKMPEYEEKTAEIRIKEPNGVWLTLNPTMRMYKNRALATSKAAIRSGWQGDLYAVFSEPVDGMYQIRVYHKAFQIWIWGAMAMLSLAGWLSFGRTLHVGRRGVLENGFNNAQERCTQEQFDTGGCAYEKR